MSGDSDNGGVAHFDATDPIDSRLRASADAAIQRARSSSPASVRASADARKHLGTRPLAVAHAVTFVVAILLLVVPFAVFDVLHNSGNRGSGRTSLTVDSQCGASASSEALLAVTASGTLVSVDPQYLRTTTIARGLVPVGGVAVRPELDVAYVTARGPSGLPAIWSVPLGSCGSHARLVEVDAELPSVSPDGGHLGYVTLDHRGEQTGVAIVSVGSEGEPVGTVRRYRAISTPPPLPIMGIAVGRDDAVLAVWGGFIDAYLGRAHPTVGELDPLNANSLSSLEAVFDAQGISIAANPRGGSSAKPEDWQSSPVYLPNGEFLVGDHSEEISMPWSEMTAAESGGGILTIEHGTGEVGSIAAGSGGDVVWIGTTGFLTLDPGAASLPFGPGADMPPEQSAPPIRSAQAGFTSVAWTIGPQAETTPLPRLFQPIKHLPSVEGISEKQAESVLAALDLPAFVGRTVTNRSVPADTVVGQDPRAGTEMVCQCSVTLTISRKG